MKNYWLSKVCLDRLSKRPPVDAKDIENAKAFVGVNGNNEKAVRLWNRIVLKSFEHCFERRSPFPPEVEKGLDNLVPDSDLFCNVQKCYSVLNFFSENRKYFNKVFSEIPNLDMLRVKFGELDGEVYNIYYKCAIKSGDANARDGLIEMINAFDGHDDDLRLLFLKNLLIPQSEVMQKVAILERILEVLPSSNDVDERLRAMMTRDSRTTLALIRPFDVPLTKDAESLFRSIETPGFKIDAVAILDMTLSDFRKIAKDIGEPLKDMPNIDRIRKNHNARDVEILNLYYRFAISMEGFHTEFLTEVLEALDSMEGLNNDSRLLNLRLQYYLYGNKKDDLAERERMLRRLLELVPGDNGINGAFRKTISDRLAAMNNDK